MSRKAELVPVNEGSIWAIVIARWLRSAGVEDHITYEKFFSGPMRSGRVHRNGHPVGASRKGRPKRGAELRPEVGPIHNTEEAIEVRDGGGKGSA